MFRSPNPVTCCSAQVFLDALAASRKGIVMMGAKKIVAPRRFKWI
jgi:hypothetical protein